MVRLKPPFALFVGRRRARGLRPIGNANNEDAAARGRGRRERAEDADVAAIDSIGVSRRPSQKKGSKAEKKRPKSIFGR